MPGGEWTERVMHADFLADAAKLAREWIEERDGRVGNAYGPDRRRFRLRRCRRRRPIGDRKDAGRRKRELIAEFYGTAPPLTA